MTVGPELAEKVRQRAERDAEGRCRPSSVGELSPTSVSTAPKLLVMIPALIAAVASMVVAVVSHQEMDDRNRRSCTSGVVVGAAATLLSFCLNPEIIRPTLTCLAYVLAILAVGIAAKVTGITTKMTKVFVHVRRQR